MQPRKHEDTKVTADLEAALEQFAAIAEDLKG